MSDLLTTYTTFSAIDYKGENTLSAFALSATPISFVADLPQGTQNKVLWSFGDGTTSKSLCAVKSYTYPGQYTVNLFVYDCYGNVRVSSFSQVMTIRDFLPLTFEIVRESGLGYNLLSAYAGQITGPLTFNAQYPIYQKPIDIYYNLFGNESAYYSISANKFAHLQPNNSLFQKVYNYSLSSYQYEEIDKVSPDTFKVFGKLDSGSILLCPSTDNGAFFVGMSGQTQAYIKFDLPNTSAIGKFKFDNTELYSPFMYDSEYVPYFNNLGMTLSAVITESVGFSALSISSTGLFGEGYPVDSFDIAEIKFENIKIPFVVRVRDESGFSNKSISDDTFDFYISSDDNEVPVYYYTIASLENTLSTFSHPGSQRYFVKFKNLTDPLFNVRINSVGYQVPLVNSLSTIPTYGRSNLFNVYPANYYDIYKKNEDFDAEENYKNLRFQEILLDKNILFEDYLGTIVGGASANHESLGRKIYEKITNFVENQVDIDRDEIFALLSQMNLMNSDTNVYDSTLMNYPEQIKRVISLASISKNRLMGTSNKFKENFDIRGHTQKDYYGINIGAEISTTAYTITAGVPIVALEKFSGDYTLLNTYQPLCASSGAFYKLSSYSSDWGWPLVLPAAFSWTDFSKYYVFFSYVDGYDNTIVNNTIDFNNNLTTIPISSTSNDLFSNYGLFEHIISDILTNVLVISSYDSSTTYTTYTNLSGFDSWVYDILETILN